MPHSWNADTINQSDINIKYTLRKHVLTLCDFERLSSLGHMHHWKWLSPVIPRKLLTISRRTDVLASCPETLASNEDVLEWYASMLFRSNGRWRHRYREKRICARKSKRDERIIMFVLNKNLLWKTAFFPLKGNAEEKIVDLCIYSIYKVTGRTYIRNHSNWLLISIKYSTNTFCPCGWSLWLKITSLHCMLQPQMEIHIP